MHYLQVYRVDTSIPPNPRWVKNVSEEPVALVYNSQAYTLNPGQILFTDMAVASIFENQGVVIEINEQGVPRPTGNRIKIYDKEPSIDGGLDSRVSAMPSSEQQQEEITVDNAIPVKLSVSMKNTMPEIRSAASEMGIKWLPTQTKQAIIDLMQKKVSA